MNYVLKVNERAAYGQRRYYLCDDGISPKISEAWTTKSLKMAKKFRYAGNKLRESAKIVEITDKELFKAKLKGV